MDIRGALRGEHSPETLIFSSLQFSSGPYLAERFSLNFLLLEELIPMTGLSSTEQRKHSSVSSNASSNRGDSANESQPMLTESPDTNNPESNAFPQSLGAFRYIGVEGKETRGRGGYQVQWEHHRTAPTETQPSETTEIDKSDRSRYDY